jgi:nitrogen fixation protein NifX
MAVVIRKLRLVGDAAEAPEAAKAHRPRTLRIAIASRDGKTLDAHFGFAPRFMVYEVAERTHRLVQAVLCPSDEADMGEENCERTDRIAAKIAALSGCDAVFSLAIGPPAAARIIRANIHPVKLAAPEPIESVVRTVQAMMTRAPPPWMRALLTQSSSSTRSPNPS